MVVGITYSNENMTISAEKCRDSMLKNGFDSARIFTPESLSKEFRDANSEIIKDGNRGAGCFWLFKPHIIYHKMCHIPDGDYIVYSDAGVEWINNPQHIIDVMDQSGDDLFLFTSGHLEHEYNKMDVIKAILPHAVNDLNGSPVLNNIVLNRQQVHASVIFIRVSEWSRRFIKEWLLWCQMPGMITDEPSKLPNHPYFKDHRHDQSILSLLAHREGIRLHYWPDAKWFASQRYRWPNDQYPLMFNHHRMRNNEYES